MNTWLLFLLFCVLLVGLYCMLLTIFRVPTRRLRQQTLSLLRQSRKGVISQSILVGVTSWAAKFIQMEAYPRRHMEATLTAADLAVTPESYLADCIVRSGLVGLLVIPAFFVMPILGIVVIVLAILYFFQFRSKANLIVKQKRAALELELPRFVYTLAQELKYDSNLQRIFRSYQKHAAPILRSELDTTLADMMSGNEEAALARWESRMNSSMLSEVVRGLQAVKRGDQGEGYFSQLSHDFRQGEIQRLKTEASLRPQKMNIYSAMIMFAFIATYFVVILVGISDTMKVFF